MAALAFLALPWSMAAQKAAAPSGFDAARLARIDTYLQQYVDSNRVAGAVGLVLRDGKVVYERAVGFADREAGRKMTPDMIFRIASQSKAITSAAVLMLVEEGKIAITDPVSRFIPAYAKTTVALRADSGRTPVPARRQVTIKDLLTHTAGVSYGTDAIVAPLYAAKGLGPASAGWYVMDKDEPICTTMERLATLPFVAQPGEAFVYGYSIDILGCVVERASGLPLDEFIRTRITDPLGMKDTYFYLPPAKRARLAAVYLSDSTNHVARAPDGARGQGHFVDGPRKSFGGGAGLVSTARDYAQFLEMLRNHGALSGVRYLSPKMVDLMTTNQIGAVYAVPGRGFGLGFETVERLGADGLASVGSFSWGGAYGSNYKVDPAEGLVMLFMINQLPNRTDIAPKFPTMVYQSLIAPRAGASVVQR